MSETFHFECIGEGGIPLVMLHGFGDTLESLKPLGLLLSRNRQVILIDLPGFGKSPYNESLISAAEIAEGLHAFLQKKGHNQIDLLGHSFGGKVSMMLCHKYPKSVRKLALIASSGLKRKRKFKETLRFSLIKNGGSLLKLFDNMLSKDLYQTWFIPKFGSSDYKNFPHVRKILIRSINESIDDQIASIPHSALLLWGALDEDTPLEMGHRLKKMIKDSCLIVYPSLGHRPFKDVGRHLLKDHLERFLSGCNAC